MGLFKKRPPLNPKDGLVLHKIEISAWWSKEKGTFVEYDTMHMEGSVNLLAGLFAKVADSEPSIKELVQKTFRALGGPGHSMRPPDAKINIPDGSVEPEAKDIGSGKDISKMTDEEIEEMIRNNDKEAKR